MSQSHESIQTVSSLLAYFRQELSTAFEKLDVEASEETEAYLVQLLDGYSRLNPEDAEAVGFDKPAALILGEAMNSPGERRIEIYRQLGDASLFNCGFFEGYISRRLVDVEYYQDVGRLAYQKLAHLFSAKDSSQMFCGIYDELAGNFEGMVEAFNWLGRSLQADDAVSMAEDLERELAEKTADDAKSLQAAGNVIDSLGD